MTTCRKFKLTMTDSDQASATTKLEGRTDLLAKVRLFLAILTIQLWNRRFHHHQLYLKQTLNCPQWMFRVGSHGYLKRLCTLRCPRWEGERAYLWTHRATVPTCKRKRSTRSSKGLSPEVYDTSFFKASVFSLSWFICERYAARSWSSGSCARWRHH